MPTVYDLAKSAGFIKNTKNPWPFPLEEETIADAIPLEKTTANPIIFTPIDAARFLGTIKNSGTWRNNMDPVPMVNGSEKDPNGKKPNEVGAKLDTGKTRPWLCIGGFSRALEEVAKVTTLGAQKYTPNGWVAVPDGVNRYMEAAVRHLLKLGSGEVRDTGEGGIGTYHKAQIAWNILASLELELRNELPSK